MLFHDLQHSTKILLYTSSDLFITEFVVVMKVSTLPSIHSSYLKKIHGLQ
jgi:hypothetical protein